MKESVPYSEELADLICAELADGKSLRTVCTQPGMPTRTAVFKWLRTKPEFLERYERAKEESADAMSDEMLAIADDLTDHPHSRRVRVDTRKWLASKMKPKKYGDKLDLTGKLDGNMTLSGVVTFVEPTRAAAEQADDDEEQGE